MCIYVIILMVFLAIVDLCVVIDLILKNKLMSANKRSNRSNCYTLSKNVGRWKDCGDGTYRGTFNGKRWKTKDEGLAEEIIYCIGEEPVVDVDDILNKKIKYRQGRIQKASDSLISEYDKLLEAMESM